MSNRNRSRGSRPRQQQDQRPSAPAQYEPPRIISSRQLPAEEREPLFYIDDDTYTIPKVLLPHIGVAYLRNLRDYNPDYAAAVLLGEAVGEGTYEVLATCKYIDHDQMASIVSRVVQKAMGAADPTTGSDDEPSN